MSASMDEHDWERAWALFTSLWPKRAKESTDETVKSYRRVCGNSTFNEVQRAMRTVKDTSSWAPHPADLRKLLHKSVGGEPSQNHESEVSWPDLIRQQMSGCTGHIREDHAAMSDDAVQHWYWSAMVVQAHRTYCNTPGCQHCEVHPEVARCVERRERFAGQERA